MERQAPRGERYRTPWPVTPRSYLRPANCQPPVAGHPSHSGLTSDLTQTNARALISPKKRHPFTAPLGCWDSFPAPVVQLEDLGAGPRDLPASVAAGSILTATEVKSLWGFRNQAPSGLSGELFVCFFFCLIPLLDLRNCG
ncbi:hypothetical protein PoMZ_01893 [Pyricularia oryzae]|uniref:Uncharacterized protein n=1 Tax=Pyricularia oryzae TaxID=318829 RepID=A0A4V1C5N2_PYROR|nr:hypothetical protein PoMZ_01893 [Pyricularia oryzae]